jgi:hypothetical protein
MIPLLAIVGVCYVVIAVCLWVAASRSPEGHQDESGFHYNQDTPLARHAATIPVLTAAALRSRRTAMAERRGRVVMRSRARKPRRFAARVH